MIVRTLFGFYLAGSSIAPRISGATTNLADMTGGITF